MNQYQTHETDLSTNDDGLRAGAPRLLVVHSFEGQDLPVARMMDYQSGRLPHQRTGSYHVVIDAAGRSGRENDNEYIPWAALGPGRSQGLHVCLSGRAAFTRDQWLARDAQLRELARWFAHESKGNAIPLEVVPVAGIRGTGRGVCSHGDLWQAHPIGDVRTDPGPAFPWDHVLQLARDDQLRELPDDERTDQMDPYKAHQLADVTEQLTGSPKPGEFPGWPQLGGRTLVDALAVIGAERGIPGFYDPRT